MRLLNILHLGMKELRSLSRDRMMIIFIVYAFTFAIYIAAMAMPETMNKAPISIVDEDRSQLSRRIADAFYPPYFMTPSLINQYEMDDRMDAGMDTFALIIPPNFQRDMLAGKNPAIQLNIDATRMRQAFAGNMYIHNILANEASAFIQGYQAKEMPKIDLALRVRFNQEMNRAWFGGIMELINHITMLSVILTGAALIREREHGTVEHLLVMPVTPFEIMMGKVWSMALVVLITSIFSLVFIVQGFLSVPIEGSYFLFLVGTSLHLFATSSLGIFMATIARTMPQFGLLLMLVLLPMEILSGSMTPRESMPNFIQFLMLAAPNTHFVSLAQSILYRNAGLSVVWPQFVALALIGTALYSLSLARFRKTLGMLA